MYLCFLLQCKYFLLEDKYFSPFKEPFLIFIENKCLPDSILQAITFVHHASGLWPSQSVHTTTNVCQMASYKQSPLCTMHQGYGL